MESVSEIPQAISTKPKRSIKKQFFSFFISLTILLLAIYFTPGNHLLNLGIASFTSLLIIIIKLLLKSLIKKSLPITIITMTMFIIIFAFGIMSDPDNPGFDFDWAFLCVPVSLLFWLLQMFIEENIDKIYKFANKNKIFN